MKNTTRLCATKPIVTVNGKFPGPTLYAREDYRESPQPRPVQRFNPLGGQMGQHISPSAQYRQGKAISTTSLSQGKEVHFFLWHAHITWLRATVHGAIVILPKRGVPYPFPIPEGEIIVLGEWWKSDVEIVINQATQSGLAPNISDAHTINGHPGPVPNCSSQGYTLHVEAGRTYLLRIINAAVNDELFFKVAGHNLTIVEVDASYTKPFSTNTLFIAPGQTTNAILTADQDTGKYLMAISPFMDTVVPVDSLTATAVLCYKGVQAVPPTSLTTIPPQNATPVTYSFIESLRSLNSKIYPVKVPLTVDQSLFFTVGVGVNPCATCVNGSRTVANINNVTFVMPSIGLLQAH